MFSELRRHDILGPIEIPCGQCIGCRMRRASDWEARVMHEASLYDANCFVTLTYGRDQLPPNGSLEHRDFQLFMKRLRRYLDALPAKPVVGKAARQDSKVRFYMCGEYGPLNSRPHYHACLFNVDFRDDRVPLGKSGAGAVFFDSPTLRKLWGLGRVSVQDLTRETAGYCARYILKKALGQNAETAYQTVDEAGNIVQKRPEYAAMSLRPGIGAGWFVRFGRDVFPQDYLIVDGVKRRVPKYYDRLVKDDLRVDTDKIAFEREKRARLSAADNTEERRAVREVVHQARLRNHSRSNEL